VLSTVSALSAIPSLSLSALSLSTTPSPSASASAMSAIPSPSLSTPLSIVPSPLTSASTPSKIPSPSVSILASFGSRSSGKPSLSASLVLSTVSYSSEYHRYRYLLYRYQ